MTDYALFFSTKKKACKERFLRPTLFFERKIVDFYFKKHARPKEILFRRFLSEAKKGSSKYCSMPCLFMNNYLFTFQTKFI